MSISVCMSMALQVRKDLHVYRNAEPINSKSVRTLIDARDALI